MIVIIVFGFSKMIYLRLPVNNQILNKIALLLASLLLLILIFIFRFDILFSIQLFSYKKLPHQEKLWAHRVNSLERLEKVQKNFKGIEADIFFDTVKNLFIINHPPASDKNLSLQKWLSRLESNKKVWFDIKLLDTSLVNIALQSLEREPVNKLQVVFECYDLISAKAFLERGYQVALNIDPYIIGGTYGKKKKFVSDVPNEILYVSQEDLYIDSLRSMFPDKKIMTWSTSFYHIFKKDRLRILLNDPKIEAVLVNIKSIGYL